MPVLSIFKCTSLFMCAHLAEMDVSQTMYLLWKAQNWQVGVFEVQEHDANLRITRFWALNSVPDGLRCFPAISAQSGNCIWAHWADYSGPIKFVQLIVHYIHQDEAFHVVRSAKIEYIFVPEAQGPEGYWSSPEHPHLSFSIAIGYEFIWGIWSISSLKIASLYT